MTFKITNKNSTFYVYKDHSYQIYKPRSLDINEGALKNAFLLCESMLLRYSRVSMLRIDLHPYSYNTNNNLIRSFLAELCTKLKQEYKCTVKYFCTREQNKSNKEHYHLAVFLSGHKVNHPSSLQKHISKLWISRSKGSTKYVKHPLYTIKRGMKNTINEAIYRLSYLAKRFSKQLNGNNRSFIISKHTIEEKRQVSSNALLLVDPECTVLRKLQNSDLSATCSLYSKQDKLPLTPLLNENIALIKRTEMKCHLKRAELHKAKAHCSLCSRVNV